MFAHLEIDRSTHLVTLHAQHDAQSRLEVRGSSIRTLLDEHGNFSVFAGAPHSPAVLLARGNLFGQDEPPGLPWSNYGIEREGE